MSTLNPYISFGSDARDAMTFYSEVFGGEVTFSTFGDMGDSGPNKDLIMHALLKTPSGFTLMASDTPEEMSRTVGDSMSISLSGSEAEELRGYFAALSDGAQVEVPLSVQMWGDEFGMLTDRFGIRWMVNITGAGSQNQA